MIERRRIVLVSGAPGAGKTTLAGPLAVALGIPLFTKDAIKETLFDALAGPRDDLAFSRRLGAAAIEVLWSIAACVPRAVLEANFRPHDAHTRERIDALRADFVEVHCDCDASERMRRFAERARAGTHPAHPLTDYPSHGWAEYEDPIGAGALLRIDTHRAADIDDLARRVQGLWLAANA